MAATLIDNEFAEYWSLLTTLQKESLLSVAKNYVQLKEKNTADDRKKIIQAERNAYLKGEDKLYSWQEVKAMALNKDQRNEL